jgi:hypothetical protein
VAVDSGSSRSIQSEITKAGTALWGITLK